MKPTPFFKDSLETAHKKLNIISEECPEQIRPLAVEVAIRCLKNPGNLTNTETTILRPPNLDCSKKPFDAAVVWGAYLAKKSLL